MHKYIEVNIMKKLLSLALCVLLFVTCFAVSANAEETVSSSVEHLADGSYFVTEMTETSSLARTAKSGTKVATYYTTDDVKVFAVKLTGYFDYTYGSSATATNQSVSVVLYKDEASFITKSSRRSGATVYGSGTVSYLGRTTAKSLNLTCDIYGNLS